MSGSCRIVVLGCPGVGKTALVVRFITKRFIGEYCPTLERVYEHHMLIGRENILLEIMDTAGQPSSISTAGHADWADCFVYIYSISDKMTFDELNRIKQSVDSIRKSPSISVLIGNKLDLHHLRQVSSADGKKLAGKWGCCFSEVSAADGNMIENIAMVFQEMCTKQHQLNCPKDSPAGLRFKKAIKKVMLGRRLMNTKPQHPKDV